MNRQVCGRKLSRPGFAVLFLNLFGRTVAWLLTALKYLLFQFLLSEFHVYYVPFAVAYLHRMVTCHVTVVQDHMF